jgi:hypothetical protein
MKCTSRVSSCSFFVATSSLVAIGAALVSTSSIADDRTSLCLAPSSASIIGMQGADAAGAVDDMLALYLAGPGLEVVQLQSRVPTHARNEAAAIACGYVLFASLKHERKSSGFRDRLAAGAIQSGASSAAVLAESTSMRVLADAAAGAASTVVMSGDVRTRDQMALTYRLESPDGRTITSKTAKRKVEMDGEDVLTPLIEIVAEAVAAAVAGG